MSSACARMKPSEYNGSKMDQDGSNLSERSKINDERPTSITRNILKLMSSSIIRFAPRLPVNREIKDQSAITHEIADQTTNALVLGRVEQEHVAVLGVRSIVARAEAIVINGCSVQLLVRPKQKHGWQPTVAVEALDVLLAHAAGRDQRLEIKDQITEIKLQRSKIKLPLLLASIEVDAANGSSSYYTQHTDTINMYLYPLAHRSQRRPPKPGLHTQSPGLGCSTKFHVASNCPNSGVFPNKNMITATLHLTRRDMNLLVVLAAVGVVEALAFWKREEIKDQDIDRGNINRIGRAALRVSVADALTTDGHVRDGVEVSEMANFQWEGQRSKIKPPHGDGSIEMLIPPVDHHQIGVERSHIEQAHAHEASAPAFTCSVSLGFSTPGRPFTREVWISPASSGCSLEYSDVQITCKDQGSEIKDQLLLHSESKPSKPLTRGKIYFFQIRFTGAIAVLQTSLATTRDQRSKITAHLVIAREPRHARRRRYAELPHALSVVRCVVLPRLPRLPVERLQMTSLYRKFAISRCGGRRKIKRSIFCSPPHRLTENFQQKILISTHLLQYPRSRSRRVAHLDHHVRHLVHLRSKIKDVTRNYKDQRPNYSTCLRSMVMFTFSFSSPLYSEGDCHHLKIKDQIPKIKDQTQTNFFVPSMANSMGCRWRTSLASHVSHCGELQRLCRNYEISRCGGLREFFEIAKFVQKKLRTVKFFEIAKFVQKNCDELLVSISGLIVDGVALELGGDS
uniref:Uncharacterized protein n=1 Tax=Pristionchus pacificus TaxID=54126 RepID=A0A2A6BLY8_PRIPA|eukprot:PDM66816.1 hypothetical protein PRIPAC_48233 [Pristionchus pacificus]